jgi:DNA helicase TIP49 (TBP-interacting protein)
MKVFIGNRLYFLQSFRNNDTKTEEKQKNAEQTKEEEITSEKVHEEQEIARRSQIEDIDYAHSEPSSMLTLIFLILGILILLEEILFLFL